MTAYDVLQLFALLLAGHAVADYPMQGAFLSAAKSRFSPMAGVPWYQPMFAHCLIQGGMVGIITGSLLLGVMEFCAHWLIDDLKCGKRIGFNVDQLLHILCKVVWVALATSGVLGAY